MAPQWMPQNIQKRLLLYVLQQLSLFSGIDLENLDVSLGSSSQITLNDVEIDTEAFKIPGVHLRNGRIKNLQLKLNMSGGVNFDVDGLFLTMALAYTTNTQSATNLSTSTATMLQSILSEHSKETIAQSTIDLAQSLMQDEDFQTPAQSFHQSLHEGQDPEEQTPSKLNVMMTKAIEMALAQLNVNINNVSVKVIMDHATVDVEIKNVSLITENGTRAVTIRDIMVLSAHPSANPGEFAEKTEEEVESQTNAPDFLSNHSEQVDDEQEYEDHVEDEDDSDDDDLGDDTVNNMMSSSILERTKDLDSSLIYSKEEVGSIYMSAASDTFQARRIELTDATRLLFINEVVVKVDQSLKVEKLRVEIDKIRVAAVPLPLTVLHIIESLGVLNPQESYHRSSGVSNTLRQHQRQNAEGTSSEGNNLFESLKVRSLEISLVSALLISGEFSKPYTLRIAAENIQLNQNDSNLLDGNVSRLYVVDDVESKVGWFEGDSTKSDIRFQNKLEAGGVTLLLYKNLFLKLEPTQIQHITNLTGYIQQIMESLSKLGSNKPINPRKAQVSSKIQTSNITVVIKLTDRVELSFRLSPLSFDSKDGSLLIKKVSIYRIQDSKTASPLVTVSNIKYETYPSEKQIRTYDNKGHETVVTTKASVSVTSIEIEHSLKEFLQLNDAVNEVINGLNTPHEEVVFKTRKKARISSNLAYHSRPAIKLLVTVDSVVTKCFDINDNFGDLNATFNDLALLAYKDGTIQLHVTTAEILRISGDKSESFLRVIYQDDRSAPVLSLRTNNFKTVNVFLRNSIIDYYTEWLSLFETAKGGSLDNSSVITMQSENNEKNFNADHRKELHFSLVNVAIGLNPGRLKSKAILVIDHGNLDAIIEHQVSVKLDLRAPSLQLIDDKDNILSHEFAKRNRNYNRSWSPASYFNSQGFISVAKSSNIIFKVDIKPSVDNFGLGSKTLAMEVIINSLGLELCSDSSQCFLQLINDLKQPIIINPESKYKVNGKVIDVFTDIDQNAFNGDTVQDATSSIPGLSKDELIDIVDDYYQEDQPERRKSDDILDQSLGQLDIGERPLANNPFYGADEADDLANSQSGYRGNNSNSTLLFDENHFEESSTTIKAEKTVVPFPMSLDLQLDEVTLKIFDGYDWKHTRTTISNTVKNLERRVTEQQKLRAQLIRQGVLSDQQQKMSVQNDEDKVFRETLFDSIHVSLPANSEDPTELTREINKNIQNIDNTTIEFGNNNIKKLKLRRTKFHKVLVKLYDVHVLFTVLSNQDPISRSKLSNSETSDEHEVVNETSITVKDLEVTDNVPTSTWNKFVTLLKDVEREKGSNMLELKMTAVRPILSSAATELIMDVEVLPLRLHVDQDTLEVLTRFGEFKDSRFQLVDEFEDVIYIQKFTINDIKVKLDYKPKKIDYAGLKSGHTTEFMNLFILDEASMVLKKVTLYGVSGFPRLGQLLNGLWMPDIKQTQLTGVLSGLAPVRSIYKIGSNFKDLVVVPMNEYKKDGRVYRSVSKGVTEFGKNTTSELLKFGIKLANGTQALLENAEYALGGAGSSARIPVDLTEETIDELSEGEYDDDEADDESDNEDPKFGLQSQLIGRSSLSTQHPMIRSTYQPALESIADIKQGWKSNERQPKGKTRSFKGQPRNRIVNYQVLEGAEDLIDDEADDESQRTLSLYANQPTDLKQGLLLAYDSLGRNFLVAKDAVINAGYEINDGGSAQSLTVAIAKATPIALLRPIIGVTEAASRALYGINNEIDPNSRKHTEDKYKEINKR
jgi:autophagy-related protein 2